MKSLNYNYVEVECKKIGAKSGQTNAAIFDKNNIAFKRHFAGKLRFFLGNTGYEFDAPTLFAVRHFFLIVVDGQELQPNGWRGRGVQSTGFLPDDRAYHTLGCAFLLYCNRRTR